MRLVTLFMIGLPVLGAALPGDARAQEPAYGGGIVVDGNAAEWNLVDDAFADLYYAGVQDPLFPGFSVLAKAYLRYDCNAQRLGILVLDEATGGLPVNDATRAFAKVLGQGWTNDLLIDGTGAGANTPREFAWVLDGGGQVIGFEAASFLAPDAYASIELGLGYDGVDASTGKAVDGFDNDTFDAGLAALNAPNTLKIRVQYPYDGGPAYFPVTDIDVDGNGTADHSIESWCIDTDHTINQNQWYCTTLISSYSYPTGLDDTREENLDVVNWILNMDFVGQDSGGFGLYTYGDVQLAIWAVIDNGSSPNRLGPWDQNRVDQILALAAVAVGIDDPNVNYEPPCDGVVGLILVPRNCDNGNDAQILVGQMLVAEFPAVCGSYETPLLLLCDGITVGAETTPAGFRLAPAQPNPFNPSTTLTVSLAETGVASLKVYDLAGREVATLLDGVQAAGERQVTFQAGMLPSGTYFAVLRRGRVAILPPHEADRAGHRRNPKPWSAPPASCRTAKRRRSPSSRPSSSGRRPWTGCSRCSRAPTTST